MKNLKTSNWIWLIPVILLAVSSCYRAPEFPVEPRISFNSLRFYDVPALGQQDSLVLTINFEDGDGDLGVEGNENLPPYHSFSFVTNDNRLVLTPGTATLLGPSSNDTMPPYNCVDYRLGRVESSTRNFYSYCTSEYRTYFPSPEEGRLDRCGMVPDTFYVKPNIFAYNFLVKFMVKRGERYEEFDFNKASLTGCGEVFNQKFPIIYDRNTPGSPLSGELTNTMISAGFINYFRNDTLKLQIQIIDRALNMSNIVETPAFHFENTGRLYQIEFLE